MTQHNAQHDDIKTLGEKIKDVRIAMLTTVDEDGTLFSRPMATQEMDFDGDLWFFTQASAPKVDDVAQENQVNVAYAKPSDQLFVSVTGTAQIVRDRQKMHDLWKPVLKVWFPNGPDDPDMALLKVSVTKAQYWEGPSNKLTQLAGFAKGLVTGDRKMGGKNEVLDFEKGTRTTPDNSPTH
jgi:general stress protein 26